jgi:hypothetical protein
MSTHNEVAAALWETKATLGLDAALKLQQRFYQKWGKELVDLVTLNFKDEIPRILFLECECKGDKAARRLRNLARKRYGKEFVDDAVLQYRRKRQAEFGSTDLYIELKNWAYQHFPGPFRYPSDFRRTKRHGRNLKHGCTTEDSSRTGTGANEDGPRQRKHSHYRI